MHTNYIKHHSIQLERALFSPLQLNIGYISSRRLFPCKDFLFALLHLKHTIHEFKELEGKIERSQVFFYIRVTVKSGNFQN